MENISISIARTPVMYHDPSGRLTADITKAEYDDLVHAYVENWFTNDQFKPRRSAVEALNKITRMIDAYTSAFEKHPPKNKAQEDFKRTKLLSLYDNLKEAEEQLKMIDEWEKEVHSWVVLLDQLQPVY